MAGGEPSPSADVAGAEPGPGADVAELSPVPVRMWTGVSPVPVQMWTGASPVLRVQVQLSAEDRRILMDLSSDEDEDADEVRRIIGDGSKQS